MVASVPSYESTNGGKEGLKHKTLWFLLSVSIFTIAFILIVPHTNAVVSTDESVYLKSGRELLEGKAQFTWPDIRVVIPVISGFFQSLLGWDAGRLAIPVIYMPLTLLGTFFLAKSLKGNRVAYLATTILATLPIFWDIGNSAMVDVPLAAFFTLSLWFWYKGINEEYHDWFVPAGICTVFAILTKLTGVLVIPSVLIYLTVTRKWAVLKSPEMLIAGVMVIGVGCLVQWHTGAGWSLSAIQQASIVPFYLNDLFRLALSPILIFLVAALVTVKSLAYLWIPVGLFALIWGIQGRFFDARQFMPLIPIVCILTAVGIYKVWGGLTMAVLYIVRKAKGRALQVTWVVGFGMTRYAFVGGICVLLVVSLVNSVYIEWYHNKTNYGVGELAQAKMWDGLPHIQDGSWPAIINDVPTVIPSFRSPVIGCDTEAVTYYLQAATNENVVEAFTWRTAYPYAEPNYSLDGLDYVVLSIYGEEYREPYILDHYAPIHPAFCFIPLRQFSIGRGSQLPSRVTEFSSDLFRFCESHYPRVATVSKGEQEVFVVYKVSD